MTKASELSSLLERADESLKASELSLARAQALARRRSLTLGLWRAGALAAAGGLVGLILARTTPYGAALGAGLGAGGGGLWLAIELWPAR